MPTGVDRHDFTSLPEAKLKGGGFIFTSLISKVDISGQIIKCI